MVDLETQINQICTKTTVPVKNPKLQYIHGTHCKLKISIICIHFDMHYLIYLLEILTVAFHVFLDQIKTILLAPIVSLITSINVNYHNFAAPMAAITLKYCQLITASCCNAGKSELLYIVCKIRSSLEYISEL